MKAPLYGGRKGSFIAKSYDSSRKIPVCLDILSLFRDENSLALYESWRRNASSGAQTLQNRKTRLS
jgi:hypothetical protein